MQFSYLALGGCPLNNPLGNLVKRKYANSIHTKMGFTRPPFALSVNAAVQLMQFCRGEFDIPKWIRDYCYADPRHVPNEQQRTVLNEADIVMMEMSTPIEFLYEGIVLNQNRFRERIVTPLRDMDKSIRTLTNKWLNEGIQKQNEDMRIKYSGAILDALPDTNEELHQLRDVVFKLRGRHVGEEEIYQGLKTLLGMLPAPLILVLHNYSYMPDGRPVIWPADFKDNSIRAASRLGIPCYDPMAVVQRHWGGDVLMEDRRHYARSFDKFVADEYLALARVYVPSLVFGDEFRPQRAA